jgi:hypothetical protein
MVTDAVFTDFNKDGNRFNCYRWMKPTFFANTNGKFVDVTKTVFQKKQRIWQAIIPFDIDNEIWIIW